MTKKRDLQQLHTPYEQAGATAWNEYPRPQMKREDYRPLNGAWELSVLRPGRGREGLGTIQVPFVPESRLSGISRTLAPGEKWFYRRTFTLAEGEIHGKRLLLHFGAADQIALVSVNGREAGSHRGGYLPFTLDITPLVKEDENELTVEVTDELDQDLPYGKQRRDPGGMWYTAFSGIWQPVWMEAVPASYIRRLTLLPDLDHVVIRTEGGAIRKRLTLHQEDGEQVVEYEGDEYRLYPEHARLWSPDDPWLYPFTLEAGEDCFESYFALRTITSEVRNGQAYFCLNHQPLFLHGLLDQGYYSDGIVTPGSPAAFRDDVRVMKELGFNFLRKHVKIESELYYEACDRQGMIVMQDLVNSGSYQYLRDTLLPTVGLNFGGDIPPSPARKAQMESDALALVDYLENHPSVCLYTIFNEGWGQYQADYFYDLLKKRAPQYLYDATSGWFDREKSDFVSRHCYFEKLKVKGTPDRIHLLSEYGGFSCGIPGHRANLKKVYGYRKYKTPEEFQKALEDQIRREMFLDIRKGLGGAVLTQVSDIEDETNGLVTYDRQVLKVDAARMKVLADEIRNIFAEAAGIDVKLRNV